MNIYLVEWVTNHSARWDFVDSLVVMAKNEDDARNMHPELG